MALTNSVKYNKNLLRMYATTKTEKRERKRERERERGGTRSPGRHFSKSFPTKNERPTRGKFHFIFSIYFSNTRPFLLPSFSPPSLPRRTVSTNCTLFDLKIEESTGGRNIKKRIDDWWCIGSHVGEIRKVVKRAG